MELRDQARLLKLRDELLDNVVFDVLSPGLIQNKLIDTEEYECISRLKQNKDKVTKLLQVLPKKGPDSFATFVQTLQEDYDWISAELDQVSVRPNEIEQLM